MAAPDIYKNTLANILSDMEKDPRRFAVSDTAFTRTKKLSFGRTMRAVLYMQGGTISRELISSGIDVTASGFVQRRDQIKPEAFEYLFRTFTKTLPVRNLYKGFRLLAIDGSEIAAPLMPDSPSYKTPGTITKNGKLVKGCAHIHLNAEYDILNKCYADAVLTPAPTEHRAAEAMIERYDGPKAIVVMDRGYIGYNTMETVIRNPRMEFLIRAANRNTYEAIRDLPYEEWDIDCHADITTVSSRYVKGQNVLLPGPSPKGKDKKRVKWFYGREGHIDYRAVRFRISDDPDPNKAYETLVTSLPREQFPLEELKKLYFMRWGIETSFRELKYNVGAVHFHSRKDDAVLQSIWSALTIYNFSMAVAAAVVIKQKPAGKYVYKVSIADAVTLCRMFLTQRNIHAPPDGKALMEQISRRIVPIRPGRTRKRDLYPKGCVYFLYRVAA